MADAAIVLNMLSVYSILWRLTFWSVNARFQKQFIDPIKLSLLSEVNAVKLAYGHVELDGAGFNVG